MCGLIGYYCFGDKRPTKTKLSNMLISCASRGTDATGVGFIGDSGKLIVIKNNQPAWKFVKTKEFRSLKLPKFMMCHTRAMTQGDATDNFNNHPIFSKSGIAVTHNGIIQNDEAVFKKKAYVREGKVDSEVILRALEEKIDKGIREAVKNCSLISGSFTAAMLSEKHPKVLTLFKHSNPIIFCYDRIDDILYYASTQTIIQAGFLKYYRGFRFCDARHLTFCEAYEDYCLIIGPKGLKSSFDFYNPDKNIPSYDLSLLGHNRHWYNDWGWGNRKEDKEEDKKPEDALYQCIDCNDFIEPEDVAVVVDGVDRMVVCRDCYVSQEEVTKHRTLRLHELEMSHNRRLFAHI